MILIPLRERAKPVGWGLLAAGVVIWAAGAAVFFRYPLFSSFDLIFGDRADGKMLVYFHEHLFHALQGRAQWLSPGFYYPTPGVLGMGPAFLLNLAPYAILRAAGCDPFLAFQLVIVILSLACFLASLAIAARYLQLRPALALCAALLMTFPNSFFVKATAHANLLMLYYVPCIVLVALWAIEDFPTVTARNIARTAIAAALLALLFSTDVYSAWMFSFTVLIAGGTVMALHGRNVLAVMRAHRRPLAMLAAAAVAFAVALVPFALIYLPVRAIAPLRSYRDTLAHAPFPQDILNVGNANLLWGWLVETLQLRQGLENLLAVTPGMTLLFVSFALLLRGSAQPARPWQTVFVACAAAVWALGWLLTERIGSVSGFWLVRQVVPGATGLRAAGRIQMMVNFWIVLGLAIALEHWMRTTALARHRRNLLAGGVLIFCLLEQINLMDNSRLPRGRELAFLTAVPAPPGECRAFFIDVPQPPADLTRRAVASIFDQTDAMWISLRTGLPTLNGFSGWAPPGWELLGAADPSGAARRWIAHSGLREQVCLYDRTARQWSLFE